MANFCKFCGKALVDGVCDCPAAVEEQRKVEETAKAPVQMIETSQPVQQGAPAPQAVPVQQAAPAPQAAPVQQGAPVPQGPAAKTVFADMKNLFLGFLKNPAETMRTAYDEVNKTAQFLMAAVYALVFILVCLLVGNSSGLREMKGKMFQYSLLLVIVLLAVKAIYAAGVYLLARRYNPSVNFMSVLGEFCLTLITETIFTLVIFLAALLGIYEIVIAVYLAWFLMTGVNAFMVTQLVCGNNTKAAYTITVILQVVLLIMIVFVGRSIMVKMIEETMGSLMSGFGRFGF